MGGSDEETEAQAQRPMAGPRYDVACRLRRVSAVVENPQAAQEPITISVFINEGTMKTHELKCWPEFFAPILSGEKTFELRKNDRDYQVGDLLHLREWDPGTKQYSGSEIRKRIAYMLEHRPNAACAARDGLGTDYVILSIEGP